MGVLGSPGIIGAGGDGCDMGGAGVLVGTSIGVVGGIGLFGWAIGEGAAGVKVGGGATGGSEEFGNSDVGGAIG